jgi:hypothetical protein
LRTKRQSGKTPLIFKADFEDSSLDCWQPTDANAWRIEVFFDDTGRFDNIRIRSISN